MVFLLTQPKFRVLMVAACPFPYPRGTPVRILRMAETMASLGHEVHVATYHLGQTDLPLSFQVHRIANLKFYDKVTPGPTYFKVFVLDFLLALNVISLVRRYKFDLVHAHHYEGLLTALPLRLLTRLPIIFDSHTLLEGELPFYDLHLGRNLKRRVGLWLDKTMPHLAHHVIAVSESIGRWYIEHAALPPEKLSIIPSGVEVEHFSRAAQSNQHQGIILGFSGNAAEYQGVEYMLRAFHRLNRRYADIALHLYSSDDFSAYDDLIETLGIRERIRIIPTEFANLPERLAEADILLNPRWSGDGYPLKLLNYMAASKAVVSFRGTAHDLRHMETGWIVEQPDPEAFAEGIQYLIDRPDLRRRLGQNARQFVEQHFTWRLRGIALTDLYARLSGRSGR